MTDIAAAVFIDWIIGDPYWFPHPVIYIGRLIAYLEKKARNLCKTSGTLKAAGGVIVITVSIICFLIPFILLGLLQGMPVLYHITNIFILWTTLAARCLHKEGIKIYHSLKQNDLEDARLKLSCIVGRDTKELTEGEIIRADVETIAENTSDGVIAPLIFAMVGGAPLAMLYKGINTMDSMLGYMNEKYRWIGFFPAKTDDVFNYIPARLTGFVLCLAAPLANGNISDSFKIMLRDRKNHKSPNCGYPEAAVAGALKIQIGGVNKYFGEVVYKPVIGDRLRELSSSHIADTIKLMYGTEVIIFFIGVIIYGIRSWR
jgi:adenosylcobinamide-phosphate synthase